MMVGAVCLRGLMAWYNGEEASTEPITCPLTGKEMDVGGGGCASGPSTATMGDEPKALKAKHTAPGEGDDWNGDDEEALAALMRRRNRVKQVAAASS
jgi:hypothetical protein